MNGSIRNFTEGPAHDGIFWIICETAKDKDGRQRFELRWKNSNHHTGHPDRGQYYNASVEKQVKRLLDSGKKVRVFPYPQ